MSFRVAAFSCDGRVLAGAGTEGSSHSNFLLAAGSVQLWDIASRQRLGQRLTLEATGPLLSVAFSPDGKVLAGADTLGQVHLWDVASRQPLGQSLTLATTGPAPVTSLAFSPDGKLLASGGYNGAVQLWDIASRQRLGQPFISGGFVPVGSLTFSPDGKVLASTWPRW